MCDTLTSENATVACATLRGVLCHHMRVALEARVVLHHFAAARSAHGCRMRRHRGRDVCSFTYYDIKNLLERDAGP